MAFCHFYGISCNVELEVFNGCTRQWEIEAINSSEELTISILFVVAFSHACHTKYLLYIYFFQ